MTESSLSDSSSQRSLRMDVIGVYLTIKANHGKLLTRSLLNHLHRLRVAKIIEHIPKTKTEMQTAVAPLVTLATIRYPAGSRGIKIVKSNALKNGQP